MRLTPIICEGKRIAEKYGIPADAREICREEGILFLTYPMGKDPENCKGFILKSNGKTAVTINSDLSERMQQIVLFHELGHYFLHVKTGLMECVHDASVYDRVSESELEANMLAAQMQLSDEAVTEAFQECGDFFSAASLLGVPAELLEFKVRLMKHGGCSLPDPPLAGNSEYLAGYGVQMAGEESRS